MKTSLSLTSLIAHGKNCSSSISQTPREYFSIHELRQLRIEVICKNESANDLEDIVLCCELSKCMGEVFIRQTNTITIACGETQTINFNFDLTENRELEEIKDLYMICYESSLKDKVEEGWYEKSILAIEHPSVIMKNVHVGNVPLQIKETLELDRFLVLKQNELTEQDENNIAPSYLQLKQSQIDSMTFLFIFKPLIEKNEAENINFNVHYLNENNELIWSEYCYTYSFNEDESLLYGSLETDKLIGLPKGNYTIVVEYLTQAIIKAPLIIGNEDTEGEYDLDKICKLTLQEEQKNKLTAQDAEKKLNNMIGLVALKQQIKQQLNFIKLQQMRAKMKLPAQIPPLHMVFTGNPGTGKTTVAQYLSGIYHGMGLTQKDHIVVTERSKLVGRYLGETEKNTEMAIAEARGGILFIDEAYNLWVEAANGEKNDFGNRVIETLLTKLADPNFDVIVILAGYPLEMDKMLSSNPGLKSRFSSYLHFPDYNVKELKAIADLHLKQLEYQWDKKAEAKLLTYFKEAYQQRTASFGNARWVVQLISNVLIPNMATRLVNQGALDLLNKKLLTTITQEDIPSFQVGEEKKYNLDEEVIQHVLQQLDTLVGLKEVKKSIHDIINLARMRVKQGKAPLAQPYAKWTFMGNTGTGKSTVAQLLTQLLYAFQIIPNTNCVEISGEQIFFTPDYMLDDLLARLVKNNHANVLFIDSDASTFKQRYKRINIELIRTKLEHLKLKTQHNYILIVAENEVHPHRAAKNEKISDEINHLLYFEDYTEEQLYTVCLNMLGERGFECEEKALPQLRKRIIALIEKNKESANLRTLHFLADTLTHKAYLRMSQSKQIEQALLLKSEDIEGFLLKEFIEEKQQQRIGFVH